MTQEQFYAFCEVNQDLQIERSADGQIIVMLPAFSDTENRNSPIVQQAIDWADRIGRGKNDARYLESMS